jgi:hypothetical protein
LALVASASMLLGATRCAAYRSVAFSLAGRYVALFFAAALLTSRPRAHQSMTTTTSPVPTD